MKITFVSQHYSDGMGYTENILPRVFASMGHDVTVIASNYQVYGNTPSYRENYESFLGPNKCPAGRYAVDGYRLLREPGLECRGYIRIPKLRSLLKEIDSDVVQYGTAASLDVVLSLFDTSRRSKVVFTECHQHSSISWRSSGRSLSAGLRSLGYFLTRTLPVGLAHLRTAGCIAISPDCVDTAINLYGIRKSRVTLLPLGTDTDLMRPAASASDLERVKQIRGAHGFSANDIVVIYTGRFSTEKNPLLAARAIESLRRLNYPIRGLFVGSGAQKEQIEACEGCVVVSFMKYIDLAELYRSADIGVWPRQESMSMLDALATGIPIIVSDTIGEPERIRGCGLQYRENSVDSLASQIRALCEGDGEFRRCLGSSGVAHMRRYYSWRNHAEQRITLYQNALAHRLQDDS